MPTLFDGYMRASDEQIADQIALLETISIANAVKPLTQKAQLGAVRAIKKVGDLFGRKVDIAEPEVKDILVLLDESRKSLDGISRAELDAKLRDILEKRSGCQQDSSDVLISVCLIDKAAGIFHIGDDYTPAQKADSVYRKFYERILTNIQKILERQSSQDSAETERKLDEKIESMSREQIENISGMLKVKKLTGRGLRSALLKGRAPSSIVAEAVNAGFGGMGALTAILSSFYSALSLSPASSYSPFVGSPISFVQGIPAWLTLLDIGSWQIIRSPHKIDSEMIAQSVWLAVGSMGRPMTPYNDELPVWSQFSRHDDIRKKDKEHSGLVKEFEKAGASVEASRRKIEKNQSEIRGLKDSIDHETRKVNSSEQTKAELLFDQERIEDEIDEAHAKVGVIKREVNDQHDLPDTLKDEWKHKLDKAASEVEKKKSELEKNKKGVTHQESVIEESKKQIREKSAKLESLRLEGGHLQNENDELESIVEEAREKLDIFEKARSTELADLWRIYLPNISFRMEPLREAAKLSLDDRFALERVLRELHDSRDPSALSLTRDSDEHDYINFKLAGGDVVAMEYRLATVPTSRIEIKKLAKV